MRLKQFMKEYYGSHFHLHIGLLFLLTFVSSAAMFAVTYGCGQIMDSISAGYQETLHRFQMIAAALMLSIMTSALATAAIDRMTAEFACRLRRKIGSRICISPYRLIERFTDGELLTMATKDVDSLKSWLALLPKTGCLPAQIGLATVFVFQYNWKFSLFLLCLIPLTAVPETLLASRLHRHHAHEKSAYSAALSFFTATAESGLLLKSYQLEALFRQKNQTMLNAYKKARMKRRLHEQLVDVYGRVFGHVTNMLILIIGAFFILAGEMTLGALTSIILLASFVGEGMKLLCEIPMGYQSAKASLSHLESLLTMEEEKEIDSKNLITMESSTAKDEKRIIVQDRKQTIRQVMIQNTRYIGKGRIYEVKSLNFSYENIQILQDISFCVNRGEKIAVVGRSGCGKSTLFKVLSGLYPPEKGCVFFQGRDAAELPPDYLLRRITAVAQETFLFQATFRENILMADIDKKDPALIQAAEKAEIHDYIKSLEKGYDTRIDTTVLSLSNGQSQRIHLARAFLRDKEIWLLDEPTSALDKDTAAQVMDNLFSACIGRTMLVILHQTQPLPLFDKILVLDKGTIADFGSHDKLMAECELYRRLYQNEEI